MSVAAIRMLALALLVGGCGSLTEVAVVVETDLSIGDEIDEVVIAVELADGFREERRGPVGDVGDLPVTLQIEGGERTDEPVTVVVQARRRGQVSVEQRARARLLEGATSELTMNACRSCRALPCGSDETCRDGVCVPMDRGELPAWDGQEGGACAATMICPAGSWRWDDGECHAAGAPPDGCAPGFTAGPTGGCVTAVPSCPMGTMALPESPACAEVAPCGDGTWGDAPEEPGVQYVDGSYRGTDSDGGQARPWRRIQDGIDAAAPGALVAVAAGTYGEWIVIQQPVRLWGRCPGQVRLVAPATEDAITIVSGALVHGLQIEGGKNGVIVETLDAVELERLWVHGATYSGIWSQAPGSEQGRVSVRRTLVERTGIYGVYALATQLTLEDSVVRNISTTALAPCGVCAFADTEGGRAHVSVARSVIERATLVNVVFVGSDGSIDTSVVREARADADEHYGWGIWLTSAEDPAGGAPLRSAVSVTRSVIEHNRLAGVSVHGGDLLLESSSVRDIEEGISDDPEPPASGPARRGGYGVDVSSLVASAPSTVDVRWSMIERCKSSGLFFSDATARVEGSVVQNTVPIEGQNLFARGITVQRGSAKAATSLSLLGSVVEGSFNAGVSALDAELVIDQSVVRDTTAAASGVWGDGVAVLAQLPAAAHATVLNSRIEANARFGIGAWSTPLTLGGNSIECNAGALAAEAMPEGTAGGVAPVTLLGGDLCGCENEATSCAAVTTLIEPPTSE